MPYIQNELKHELTYGRFPGDDDRVGLAHTPGELNYLLTQACIRYLKRKGENYTHLNDVIGALECAKQEFYRRVVVPYEQIKLSENGDVY